MGAAIFVGGPYLSSGAYCKASKSEFDTPAEHTLSAVNMIASVGDVEAMHFDPAVSAGLIITDNIDELVNGNPSTSRLPLTELTAEILFNLGIADVDEHPLFSAMQRRECGDATRPKDCGCDNGLRMAWRWTDYVTGKLTFSLALAVEKASADPNNYGPDFLKFTKTNIGPGVGYVQYVEWTSADNFAFKGDWIDVGFTYDGKIARIFTNGSMVLEQHLCKESCPVDDPDCKCGQIVYPAAYHTCPQFCECPTEECKRLNCPCGSNDPKSEVHSKACHQGDDAEPGEKTFCRHRHIL